MRKFFGILSLVGTIGFGAAFLLSYIQPAFVESLARKVVLIELEHRVGTQLDSLQDSRLGSVLARISGRNAEEIDALKRGLAKDLPARIGAIADQMRDPSCPCRKMIEAISHDRLAQLTHMNERIDTLIRTKYMEVAAALTREFRIFTGVNALVFALLGIAVVVRKRAGVQLLLPALVLIGSALLVGGMYLFEQDWLHTILFGRYVGLAYFAWMGLAIACLSDVVFNRGRVVTRLMNGTLHAVGSTLSVVPC
ncbi:MAG: hypothetical protein ABIT83_13570 [Massilia sp.]